MPALAAGSAPSKSHYLVSLKVTLTIQDDLQPARIVGLPRIRSVLEPYPPPALPPRPRTAEEARQQLQWYHSQRNERNYQHQQVDAMLAEGQRVVMEFMRLP